MFASFFWACTPTPSTACSAACSSHPLCGEGEADGEAAQLTTSAGCGKVPVRQQQPLCAPPTPRGPAPPPNIVDCETTGSTRGLLVPPIFTRFQFSVIYTQLGATQGTLMEQQRNMLQAILKSFTKDLLAGVVLSVVGHTGRAVSYSCRLDRKLTKITMHPDGTPSNSKGSDGSGDMVLVFGDIVQICSPEEVRNLNCSGTTPLFSEERCTTLVLAKRRFVTFRLDSVAEREYLMLCLQVLRMSQDQAQMWYNSNRPATQQA